MSDTDRRITVRLSKASHHRFRLVSMLHNMSMQKALEEAVSDWMQRRGEALKDVIGQTEDIISSQQQDKDDEGGEVPDRRINTAA